MTQAKITERQQYWREHVLAAAAHEGSIVEYAAANNLKTKDLYQWKTALIKRGFLPLEGTKQTSSEFAEITITPEPLATPTVDDVSVHCRLTLPTRGLYYYLYMIMDVRSRKIVGHEVYACETGELAAELIARTVLAEGCRDQHVILHADNGAPQRSSTLRIKLDALGLRTSYSRPRVSNDNPYSESLFRTIKYRHDFPVNGFQSIESARD